MRNLLLILIIFGLANVLSAQSYSYEVEMRDFKQINETEFQWDIYLRKGSTSDVWALYMMQTRIEFNTNLLNGGGFENSSLTIDPSETQLFQESTWFNNAHVTIVQSGTQINWATIANPNDGENVTIMDDTWRKVATFKAQLLKSSNPQNFSDVDPEFAFELSGLNLLVRRCDDYSGENPNAVMVGGNNHDVPRATVIPALGVKVNTRELAGYWFTGEGNWSETARWNNVTTENANTVPPLETNNVGIVGSITVSDAREVNQLTLAEGAYLVISETGSLTTGDLFNDNPSGAKSAKETVTIAGWDFQTATPGQTQYPYKADYGVPSNINNAPLTTTATPMSSFDYASSGGTIAPRAQNWYYYDEDEEIYYYYSWVVQFSTFGYQFLKLSSKQRSVTTGPLSFRLQWSLNGLNWTDVSGGTVTVDQTWTTGVVSSLQLPNDLNNQANVYVRWLNTSLNGIGSSAIDDILITGEEIPPPPTGILVQSTASGTGSLIHNTTGVEATVERYINRWSEDGKGVEHGWHFLSSPVASQAIRPEFVPSDNPIPEYIDFYKWDESHSQDDIIGWWINAKDATFYWNDNFEDNFVVGRGYLMAYGTPPGKEYGEKAHLFEGEINVEDITLDGLTNTTGSTNRGWHLVGNPFSSAIDWNQEAWTKTNIGAIPQIWNETDASYTVLGDDNSNIIPTHNGFMVYTTGSGTLTIPADARLHSSDAWYKSGSSERIVLAANDAERGTVQQSIIRFNPDATESFDMEYDATYISGFAPMFYSVSDGKLFALNTLPQVYSELEIPMGFVKNGSDNFTIEVQESIQDLPLYLHDQKLNILHNLNENPVYAFTSKAGDNPNRFVLKFGVVSISDPTLQSPEAWFSEGHLFFYSTGQTQVSFTDITGRVIAVETTNGDGLQILPANLPKGIYIAVIQDSSQRQTVKLIIQ